MTENEKDDLKEKGEKFLDDQFRGLKDIFGKAEIQSTGANHDDRRRFSQA